MLLLKLHSQAVLILLIFSGKWVTPLSKGSTLSQLALLVRQIPGHQCNPPCISTRGYLFQGFKCLVTATFVQWVNQTSFISKGIPECWFTQLVVFPEDVIHSYPAEKERTTFESPLKEGWIKLCSLWKTVFYSMMWMFLAFLSGARVGDEVSEAANGDVRTACRSNPRLWERRDFLFSEDRQSGPFWSWGQMFPDHEDSQLKPHFCALLQYWPWGFGKSGKGACSGDATKQGPTGPFQVQKHLCVLFQNNLIYISGFFFRN